jgi:hypothetical protein
LAVHGGISPELKTVIFSKNIIWNLK